MKCINAVHKKTRDFILAFFYVGMTFFVQNCFLCKKSYAEAGYARCPVRFFGKPGLR